MKKLLAVALVLGMLLSLSGCFSFIGRIIPTVTPNGPSATAVTVVGDWKGSLDISKVAEELGQIAPDKDLSIDVVFSFAEDGTFTIDIEEASAQALMDTLVDAVVEMIEEACREEGITLEEALGKEDMTIEELRQMYAQEMDVKAFLETASVSGVYKAEEGKIHIAMDEEDLNAGDYESTYHISLTRSTLTIQDIESEGELASTETPEVFPVVLKRQ